MGVSTTGPISGELAIFICTFAVAVIGVSIALTRSAWNNFEVRYANLLPKQRKSLMKNILIIISPFILLILALTITGIYRPSSLNLVFVIFLFLIIASVIFGRIKKVLPFKDFNEREILYPLSCIYLLLSVICELGALLGASSTALDIHIGPHEPENFIWGKWFLFDGILFFILGCFFYGIKYIWDAWEHITRLSSNKKRLRSSKNNNLRQKPIL